MLTAPPKSGGQEVAPCAWAWAHRFSIYFHYKTKSFKSLKTFNLKISGRARPWVDTQITGAGAKKTPPKNFPGERSSRPLFVGFPTPTKVFQNLEAQAQARAHGAEKWWSGSRMLTGPPRSGGQEVAAVCAWACPPPPV